MSTPKFGGFTEAEARASNLIAALPVQLGLGLRSLALVDPDAELQRRFAYALNAAMASKGWKAPDLARAINRDPSTVDRWANGRAVPNIFTIKPISDALGVRPEFLYDPPPVPDYPLSDYLVQQATQLGVAEQVAAARRVRRRTNNAGP